MQVNIVNVKKNCKCRKKVVTTLTEKCTETAEEAKLTKSESESKCIFCTVYIALFSISFTINIGIVYVYSQCYLKKNVPHVDFNTCTEKKLTKHVNGENETN